MVRMRTVCQAVREIRKDDPDTAMTETLLRRLIRNGEVSCTLCGSRECVEMDRLDQELSAMFGIEGGRRPKMRTVRTAAKAICDSDEGNVLTEYRIRMLLRSGHLQSYEAGTRQIIALETFEDKNLFTMRLNENRPTRNNRSQSVCLSEQFDDILSETTQKYVCRRRR